MSKRPETADLEHLAAALFGSRTARAASAEPSPEQPGNLVPREGTNPEALRPSDDLADRKFARRLFGTADENYVGPHDYAGLSGSNQ